MLNVNRVRLAVRWLGPWRGALVLAALLVHKGVRAPWSAAHRAAFRAFLRRVRPDPSWSRNTAHESRDHSLDGG